MGADDFKNADTVGPSWLTELPSGLLVAQTGFAVPITILTTSFSIPRTVSNPFVPRNGVMRYVHERMTADDYAPIPRDIDYTKMRVDETSLLLSLWNHDELLGALAAIGMSLEREEFVDELIQAFGDFLKETGGARSARFASALLRTGSRGFLPRQSLLSAYRSVLGSPDPTPRLAQIPPVIGAVLLCHTLASISDRRSAVQSIGSIGGLPADLAIELIRNQVFYRTEDLYSLLDRVIRLWRDYGPAVSARLEGRSPANLLKLATGIEIEDFLSLGLCLVAFVGDWAPGKPTRLNRDFGADIDDDVKQAFLRSVARGKANFRSAFTPEPVSDWDFLEFQATPILEIDDGLLVIDKPGLIARITSGLYWDVHDYLRDVEGKASRESWNQAWGEMIEMMAEDELRPHVPPALDGGTNFYTEHDLGRAYPGHKRADALIDFGLAIGIFEVVSGQLKTQTRIGGDVRALESDMKRLAFEKIEQLDDTANCLIDDESSLTGLSPPEPRPIQPVIIAGGGFPVSPPTTRYIEEWCLNNGHLQQPSVLPLAIIELAELEMLEGLGQEGINPLYVIRRWKQSDISEMPLRNYLHEHYEFTPERYRPARMRPRVDATFDNLVSRLKLRTR